VTAWKVLGTGKEAKASADAWLSIASTMDFMALDIGISEQWRVLG
jgi:hypothetical protein